MKYGAVLSALYLPKKVIFLSEKEIKTKPKSSTKIKEAPKTASRLKDAKASIKTATNDIGKNMSKTAAIKTREAFLEQNNTDRSAQVEATENVESAGYYVTDKTVSAANNTYHKGKDFAKDRYRNYKAKKAEKNEAPEQTTEVKAPESNTNAKTEPKTRESVQSEGIHPKTKDNTQSARIKQKPSDDDIFKNVNKKAPEDARREYVKNKLEAKKREEAEVAESANKDNLPKTKSDSPDIAKTITTDGDTKPTVKTKQKYMADLRAENAKAKTPTVKDNITPKISEGISRNNENKAKAVKSKEVTAKAKSNIKSGDVYSSTYKQKKTIGKGAKRLKTQNAIKEKAKKEAAKRAKQAAQKAAAVAKQTAKAVAKFTAGTAKAIGAALKVAGSIIGALGGGVVLLIILIIVIIVAAIAASPFGIFLSDDSGDKTSIPLSAIIAECNMELSDKLTEIENNNTHDRVEFSGEPADWNLVLSVFSVKVAGRDDDEAVDVVVIDEDKKKKLKEVFWDMNSISHETKSVTTDGVTETVLYITVSSKTRDDMISEYSFSKKQKEALQTMLEESDGMTASMQSLTISNPMANLIAKNLPDDLSPERADVVKKACSLVGKVNYFWGGKSTAIGWDSRWGKLTKVSSEGSHSTGTMRPFGLDCSGYVGWCFVNAGFTPSSIGFGTYDQNAHSTRISWSEAKPGDLAFYSDQSHVGIIVCIDLDGMIIVAHCSSGNNNVVITNNGGFGYAARPRYYKT